MATPDYTALSASDGAGEPVRATVQANRSIGSTSIIVNATTNWPTGTFIATTGTLLSTGKLDPTTAQVFYGTASGTTITITAFAAGYTDKGNAINDVVVIKPTTEWANIVAQGVQSTSQFPANFQNFVEATGGVWTAGSGLIGSATSGFVWYAGTRSAMAAVTTHTFTASKDTYVDYNPSAATWTYVPVTNGATEPAVTANCVRIAKVVTGASAISSISQQAYSKPLPLVWQYLGSATKTSAQTLSSASNVAISSLNAFTVTIPSNVTLVRITVYSYYLNTPDNDVTKIILWTGSIGGTQIGEYDKISLSTTSVGPGQGMNMQTIHTPSAGSLTYYLSGSASGINSTFNASSTAPAYILVECC